MKSMERVCNNRLTATKEAKTMSKRKLDEYGNWRSKAVTFNMSPEEELFEQMVHISGLCKRDFIANRLLKRDVRC